MKSIYIISVSSFPCISVFALITRTHKVHWGIIPPDRGGENGVTFRFLFKELLFLYICLTLKEIYEREKTCKGFFSRYTEERTKLMFACVCIYVCLAICMYGYMFVFNVQMYVWIYVCF